MCMCLFPGISPDTIAWTITGTGDAGMNMGGSAAGIGLSALRSGMCVCRMPGVGRFKVSTRCRDTRKSAWVRTPVRPACACRRQPGGVVMIVMMRASMVTKLIAMSMMRCMIAGIIWSCQLNDPSNQTEIDANACPLLFIPILIR